MVLTAIKPKHAVFDSRKQEAAALQFLRGSIADAVRDLGQYPQAQPWRSRPPATGPRAGGRRTGTLGRNWSSARITKTPTSWTVENATPYGIHVEGPPDAPPRRRQTPNMRERGWPNVKAIAAKTQKKRAAEYQKALRA